MPPSKLSFGSRLNEESETAHASWRRGVEKALGGVPFEHALSSRTRDGLLIEPIYTARSLGADFDPLAVPGRPPYRRGRRAHPGWLIAQEIAHPWVVEAAEAMRTEQRRGVRLLWLELGGIVSPGAEDLEAATDYDGVCVTGADDFEKLIAAIEEPTEVVLYSGDEALAIAAMWIAAARHNGLETRDLRGNFGCDPLTALSADGVLNGSLEGAFRELAELAAWTAEKSPRMRAAMVHAGAYHDAGATALQELAFATATGVCYLRRMTSAGLGIDAAAAQVEFSFSVGRDFFLEVAKLRAARLLWSKVVGASGGGESSRAMRIHARTSALETSRLDPWMNLVRGGAQSFAAALGGADSIRTAPWDQVLGWPDDNARRLAANVQHILAEEARLDRVADAAGGSWYLESLTDSLARGAWEIFRELERDGGMARCVTGGLVAERLRATAAENRRQVANGRAPIIGASAFVDPDEESVEPKLPVRLEVIRPPMPAWAEESDSISIQELLDSESLKLGRSFAAMKQIDSALAVISLSVEAPGEPGELMEVSIDAAAAGARGEQILDALLEGDQPAACDKLARFRLARPFEQLRASSDRRLASHGHRPRVLLLRLEETGEAAGHAAADRPVPIRRLFAAGGIESIDGGAFTEVAGAAEHFVESQAEAAVVFAEGARGDEGLTVLAGELAARLKQQGAIAVFLAGRPDEHEFPSGGKAAPDDDATAAGIDGFIHDGCDVLALLTPFYDNLPPETSS